MWGWNHKYHSNLICSMFIKRPISCGVQRVYQPQIESKWDFKKAENKFLTKFTFTNFNSTKGKVGYNGTVLKINPVYAKEFFQPEVIHHLSEQYQCDLTTILWIRAFRSLFSDRLQPVRLIATPKSFIKKWYIRNWG